jgi:hypothetical protein
MGGAWASLWWKGRGSCEWGGGRGRLCGGRGVVAVNGVVLEATCWIFVLILLAKKRLLREWFRFFAYCLRLTCEMLLFCT